jgi:hypothetical protein
VNVGEGVNVPSDVGVALGLSVGVKEGTGVSLGSAVCVSVTIGVTVPGKIWFATGSPNRAEATVEENKTSANKSHCQPASM